MCKLHTYVDGLVEVGEEEEEDPLPVARAPRRSAHVLDDTQPVEEPVTGEHAAKRGASNRGQAAAQPNQATQPGLTPTGATASQPAGEMRADAAPGGLPATLQQLGLESPGLPDQAGGPSAAEGQALATAGEPEQALPVTGPASGALFPSTQDPDQAVPAWTPLTSPDGWRSKRKARSTETSPAATPKG